MSNKKSKAIAFDFDGVIHSYTEGRASMTAPNANAFKTLKKLHDQGYKIIIFSCSEKERIVDWFNIHWVNEMHKDETWKKWEITNIKPIDAIAFVDDRAIRFTSFKDIEKYFV